MTTHRLVSVFTVSAQSEGDLTPAQLLSTIWDAFVQERLSPLRSVGLAALIVFLALLLLARLLTGVTLRWPRLESSQRGALPWIGLPLLVLGALLLTSGAAIATIGPGESAADGAPPPASHPFVPHLVAAAVIAAVATAALFAVILTVVWDTRSSQAARKWAAWWAPWFGAATLAGALVWGITSTTDAEPETAVTIIFGIVVAAAGVFVTTTWIATRLGVTVEVQGKKGEVLAAEGEHVIALLSELGAEPPRGLEVPAGTDVTALSGSALSELPHGKVAHAVVKLVQGFLGTTPWRVTVGEENSDHIAVTLSRNGRTADAAVIDRDLLLRDVDAALSEKVDLHRAAAAVVLTTLARHHTGFDGLCGATSWRSVALFYVATTDFRHALDEQKKLLAAALVDDPGNWLAHVALRRAFYRHATEKRTIEEYAAWLDQFIDYCGPAHTPRSGFEELRLRSVYTRTVLELNKHGTEQNRREPDADSQLALTRLFAELSPPAAHQGRERLIAALRAASLGLVRLLPDHSPGDSEPTEPWSAHGAPDNAPPFRLTPSGAYNFGCYLVMRNSERTEADDWDLATRYFRATRVDPHLATWMTKDPVLAVYVKSEAYRQEFGDPLESDVFALPFLVPFADRLKPFGLVDDRTIAAAQAPDLARRLAVPASTAQQTSTSRPSPAPSHPRSRRHARTC